MASIFKRKRRRPIPVGADIVTNKKGLTIARWSDERGRRLTAPVTDDGTMIVLEASKYTINYIDHEGRRRTVPGSETKETTKAAAAEIEKKVYLRRHDVIDPLMEQMASAANVPIDQHLREFNNSLQRKGTSDKTVETAMRHVEQFVDKSSIDSISRLTTKTLDAYVVCLRNQPARPSRHEEDNASNPRMSARTVNSHIRSIKQFSRWLWETNRVAADPLSAVKINTKQEEKDRRHVRRNVTNEQLVHLIATTESAPDWTWRLGRPRNSPTVSVSGPERAMLYRVAVGTGLRVSELANLKPSAFRLDATPPTVTAMAAYAKGSRTDQLPISDNLAAILRPWLAQKPEGRPVFTLPRRERVADMLRADLERAGIPYKDAEGRVFDFHATRGQYITSLGKSGASQVVVQQLARHKDFNTTRRYLHLTVADGAAAVNNLPSVGSKKPAPQLATGTDSRSAVAADLQHTHRTNRQNIGHHATSEKYSGGGNNRLSFKGETLKSRMRQHKNKAACPSGLRERIANPLANANRRFESDRGL